LLLLLTVLLWHTAQPRAVGPAEGTQLDGPNPTTDHRPPATGHLRIGAYNIHGGVGTDDCRDLDRVAKNVEGLDFVALNEVHGSAWSLRDNQAAALGRLMNQSWLFAPASQSWSGALFGNGLVTRVPCDSWQRIPLKPLPGHGQRNAGVVDLNQNGRKVHILLTHIVRGQLVPREEQLAEVIAIFLALPEPAVLLGDLNSTSDSPTLAKLLARKDVIDAIGQTTGDKKPGRIDWIIVRGLRCVAGGVRDNGGSDHPLVWAELE
jgi:endonuclease/exonuclease/phosphatase family metal-dependent hydrolase